MKAIKTMHIGMINAMLAMIERDLELHTENTESRRNNLELLAQLKAQKEEIDFAARQTTMFSDFFQLEVD